MVDLSLEAILGLLKPRGLRITPQRRAIVSEVMAADGHITATAVAKRLQKRIPGVNPSTVYRTLDLLEEVGVLAHTHFESGAGYHRRTETPHLHLICAECGSEDSLPIAEAERLRTTIVKNHGFKPDLTHFAISGLCSRCQEVEAKARRRISKAK